MIVFEILFVVGYVLFVGIVGGGNGCSYYFVDGSGVENYWIVWLFWICVVCFYLYVYCYEWCVIG